MKQLNMFNAPKADSGGHYTKKIKAPVYKPKNQQPHLLECFDRAKASKLISEIESSLVTDEEKRFLREAATRHIVFNYERIADYYSHASFEMQSLMEQSALVIIDFDKAIELGYVKVCKEIEEQYREEYTQQ
tara:strand:+ start:208 stop:603 length:396 start_codon:yes stop_codon:yes gene_type:complete